MAMNQEELEQLPPQGHVKLMYLGPVAPHWEVHGVFGDGRVIDEFRQRALARLQLLPPARPAVPAQPGAGQPRRGAGTPDPRLGPRIPRGRRQLGPAGAVRRQTSAPGLKSSLSPAPWSPVAMNTTRSATFTAWSAMRS